MAGYRIGAADRQALLAEGESSPQARVMRATSCYDVMGISEDFQDVIRSACARCQGGAGACLAQQMRALADVLDSE